MKSFLSRVFGTLKATTRSNQRLLIVVTIVACLVPVTARAAGVGDILSLLNTIISTIQDSIGTALSGIQMVSADLSKFHQNVIWPVAGISRTRTFVTSTIGRYQSVMSGIQALRANSATLTNPSQLESVMRAAQGNSISQLQNRYVSVYNSVPGEGSSRLLQRNMMDADDAFAQASLKTTVLSDQTTENMLTIADGLEQQSANSAPGSAPMIRAGAQIASLEGQAYVAKMLAAELRLEAAKLAHENALVKQSATSTRNLQNQMQQALAHP
jgi:hypothetical protein